MAEDQVAEDLVDSTEGDASEGEAPSDSIRRKKDIVDHVANATGLKKRDVREALDTCFTYLHTQLSEGRDIAYPQLGKIRQHVQRPDGPNPKPVIRVALSKQRSGEETVEDGAEDA